jgi:pyruvate/2-oxoacid:ferredoxin oxidoreductase alpha subunit
MLVIALKSWRLKTCLGEINMKRPLITVDGNEAVALVAHKVNEVIAIYPITPSSAMGTFGERYRLSSRCNRKVVRPEQCMGHYKLVL